MKPTLNDLRPPLFYIPKKYLKEAEAFFGIYEMEEFIPCPPIQYGTLKSKTSRICRFCGKAYPETTFKLDAHYFSELLGNQHLLSDFECDKCNVIFGKYENDLAHFLSVSRTINRVKGKNKIPKYKSPHSSLVLQANSLDNFVTISRTDDTDSSIFFNPENCSVVLKVNCSPYIPLNVYKAILKIALSVLPEKYVPDYETAFKYSISESLNEYFVSGQMISLTQMPFTYTAKFPIGMLFKKRNSDVDTFTHVFCLYFQNFIFQIVVPLYNNDMHLYDQRKIVLPICPLICPTDESANTANEFDTLCYDIDLSSIEPKKDDFRTVVFPVNEEILTEIQKTYTDVNGNTIIDLNRIVEIQLVRQ